MRSLLPWLVLAFALGSRLGYWSETAREPATAIPQLNATVGTPLFDSAVYHDIATDVAEGRGVPSYWQLRRQVYPFALALCYVWTIPSFSVAIGFNVLLSSWSILLMYLAAARWAGTAVGLATALWMCGDLFAASMVPVVMTETLGMFFLAWHFERLSAGRTSWYGTLLWSGVFLALSNLTRSLTLFAAPLQAVVILVSTWRREGKLLRAVLAATVFTVGVTAPIVGYSIMQWYRTGDASISDNLGMHLYGVTADPQLHWLTVERTPRKLGITEPSDVQKFYWDGAREHFRKDPTAIVRNVAGNFRVPIEETFLGLIWNRWFLYPLWGAIFFIATDRLWTGPRRWWVAAIHAVVVAIWSIALAWGGTLVAIEATALMWTMGLFIGLAVLCALFDRQDLGLHLVLMALMIYFTCALFFHWEAVRIGMYVEPLVMMLFFRGVSLSARVLSTAVCWALEPASLVDGSTRPTGREVSLVGAGWVLSAMGLAVVLGSAMVAYRSYVSPRPAPVSAENCVATDAFIDLLQTLESKRPDLLSAREGRAIRELSRGELPPPIVMGEDAQSLRPGDLVVLVGRITPYVYLLPAQRMGFTGTKIFFEYRHYERTVFQFEGALGRQSDYYREMVAFPGRFAKDLAGEYFAIVGRSNVDMNRVQEEKLIEGFALVPLDPETWQVDVSRMVIGDDVEHLNYMHEIPGQRPDAWRWP